MTGVDLAAMRALAEKATPGERQALGGEGVCLAYGGDWIATTEDGASPVADAEFIAACDPLTVLALVEAVEAAQAFVTACEFCPMTEPQRLAKKAAREALASFRQEQP